MVFTHAKQAPASVFSSSCLRCCRSTGPRPASPLSGLYMAPVCFRVSYAGCAKPTYNFLTPPAFRLLQPPQASRLPAAHGIRTAVYADGHTGWQGSGLRTESSSLPYSGG